MGDAFDAMRGALQSMHPGLESAFRAPVPFHVEWANRAGAEQICALWSFTGGEREDSLGVLGGLRLLGPIESEREREKWMTQMTSGTGFDAIAHPAWDESWSLDKAKVRAVYYAAGWIPLLAEPMEANYLAVDLMPEVLGTPGQIILCGRDEDAKRVIAPDVGHLLRALAEDCRCGHWRMHPADPARKSIEHMTRDGKRFLSACKEGALDARM